MYRSLVFCLCIFFIVSCNDSSNNAFAVNGSIQNNTAQVVYLEEVPAVGTSMQPIIVDSAKLGKDGRFSLHADPKESVIYNLRLDQNMYPLLSVINDAPAVDLAIHLKDGFTDSYEVKNSPASIQLKDFIFEFTNRMQKLFYNARKVDSLQKAGADSSLLPAELEGKQLASDLKNYSKQNFEKASDPALLVFELGYYMSTANSQRYGVDPFEDEEIHAIISQASKKFPKHQALAAIQAQLDEQKAKTAEASWIGKEAPDFTLPDVNGKDIKLSSFRGKYVLVDFWASWCSPCRAENPNVVKAYNQFRDKNFTILGVSLDRPGEKDKWQKAVSEDGLAWTQVSDLQYWDSPVVGLYHIDGIPFNILIDPAGKVVGERLTGRKLETKLSEIFN